jgi:[methyl-Co(III) methanol-specific corrinoid protein]:coenzyme M methyltransferase
MAQSMQVNIKNSVQQLVHQQMVSRIKGPTIMHICGDVTSPLHMFSQIGLTCFNFDWAVKPKAMVEAAAGNFTVMGNINTTDMLNAHPAEIERQVFENIEAGVNIISPGCAVSPLCPNSNLLAMAKTLEKQNCKAY